MLKYALLCGKKTRILHFFAVLPLTAFAEEPMRYEIKDHYKTIVMKRPYQVEECEERLVGGDKTGDTLSGALVGAAIGNAIGKDTEATVAGAAVGGLIGHNKSKRRPYYQMDCKIITRYERTEKEVYSHSTISFTHEGVVYNSTFDKGL